MPTTSVTAEKPAETRRAGILKKIRAAAGLPRISRSNPFRVGDAVFHPGTGQRGIVREVRNTWVRFQVFGKTAPGGKPYWARFTHTKLRMLATREQLIAHAMKLKRQHEQSQKPLGRVAAYIRKLWKGDPAPSAQSA